MTSDRPQSTANGNLLIKLPEWRPVLLISMIVVLMPGAMLVAPPEAATSDLWVAALAVTAIAVAMVIHEALHAAVAYRFTRQVPALSVRGMRVSLLPDVPLPADRWMLVLAAPVVMFVVAVPAVVLGGPLVRFVAAVVGAALLVGSFSDFYQVWKLRSIARTSPELLLYNHPDGFSLTPPSI